MRGFNRNIDVVRPQTRCGARSDDALWNGRQLHFRPLETPSRTGLSTNGSCQLEKTENLASEGPSAGDLHGSPTLHASF